MQVRSVIAPTGVGRALLFTVTFLGSVVVVVATAGMGPAATAQAVAAMLILPVLPVAIGRRIGATKRGQVAPVYARVPLALAMFGAETSLDVSHPRWPRPRALWNMCPDQVVPPTVSGSAPDEGWPGR